jgi:DsbC/DsbD-like thiol-disulfide interchange protein
MQMRHLGESPHAFVLGLLARFDGLEWVRGEIMRVHKLSSLFLCAAIVACAASMAHAAASAPVEAGEAKVRLLASGNTNSAPVFSGGVEVTLTSGWKTYWRYPGDAGIPPRFDWSGSENVTNVEVLYPAPKRITDGSGQVSIGYEDSVIFPLRIHAADPAKPVRLKLKLDFATCEKICIPAEAVLALDIAAGAPEEPALKDVLARVPRLSKAGDTELPAIVSVSVDRGKQPDGKDAQVLVTVNASSAAPLDLFAEGPTEEWTLALPKRVERTGNFPVFSIPLAGARMGKTEVPPKIRLTLVSGVEAIEVEVPLN